MHYRLSAFTDLIVGALAWSAIFSHQLPADEAASAPKSTAAEKPGVSESPRSADKHLQSGPAAGQEVPSFFVRAITGPQMNRSVCFVCRNGDRPVVMVVLRRLETGTAVVLKAIDELIGGGRAEGLRAFGVMLSDEPGKVAPHLQTISFDEKLSLPLSVGPETLGERDTLSVDSAASLTIVVYRQRKVAWTAALRSSELRDEEARTRRVREIV